MRIFLLTVAAAMLVACSSAPPPPDWQSNAFTALEGFEKAYLTGAGAAEAEFARARAELTRTGRVDLVARAELTRCAARVASLEFDECPGFAALSIDAPAPERAYAAYIGGRWQDMDAALLPAHHRAVAGGNAAAMAAIQDPLARLVAAGALMRAGRIEPAGVAIAVDAASANGWRRPLLAWLGVQLKRAEAGGDAQEAARIRRRIELVGGSGLNR